MLACKYEPSHLHTHTPLQISPQILYETPHETLHHPNAQAHLHNHLLLPNCVGFLPNLLPRVPIENSRDGLKQPLFISPSRQNPNRFLNHHICRNQAYFYSQLELYKHVIKDCNKALQIDSTLLQVYTLKRYR
ncbi:putative tetratricopeptide-like helical domain superfamily [Helianthus annuus]|nr:putative tetratricopeptide-like helical domain superfamily [Helianthus annuus]